MIKEIIIKNFEAHKEFKAKLDPHITTFTGATDKGKSSIIRAINWVVTNRPLGDSFIRNKNKTTLVGIKTENGTVTRRKGKGINEYKINGQTLEAFGTNVPEEVKQFLNMDELNFQLQFDAPYWFMISPGEVSKQLNQIVDLEIIDTSLARMSSKVRQGKTEVNLCKDRLDEAKDILTSMYFMKPMLKDYSRLENIESRRKDTQDYFNAMSVSIEDVKRYRAKEELLRDAHSDGRKLVKIGDTYEKKSREVEDLSDLVETLENNISIVHEEIPNVEMLTDISNDWKELEMFCSSLSKYMYELFTEQKRTCELKKDLERKKRKLKSLMGTECPLCGQAIK